jgi:DNA-binding NarL/FixJ family response regulator
MSEKLLNCVVLADGHSEFTDAVRALLETAFKAVLTVTNEASLLEGVGRLRPDVMVVDLSLAHNRSLGWLQAVRQCCPEARVIVISAYSEESVRQAALKAGADEYVLKREIATDLLPAVARLSRASADGGP